ncbi:hypothetical protein FOXG_19165 [Fusarium oxysporum f. sp. lycopersici 4287]|nr:hypothetical protein FOXG_19165 [Fusarium oxysporum f. sp. lycopersici 4287]EXK33163.1 hypothetical protein FOMG_11926 [Fusarium oxysporum f. sp. melonis 26406]EXM23007.1 hypothetical protein FOTG_09355 [Fusarium oxysporum f. sp. vasinfectum 25433]KAI8413679.1 hypothetical protein FOFC_06962 [Fusarium oxysporum]KNB03584.1 hypothetical protein FOXG_19165 [Fusarium oxysporum f. sp. lycopersici 4287]
MKSVQLFLQKRYLMNVDGGAELFQQRIYVCIS